LVLRRERGRQRRLNPAYLKNAHCHPFHLAACGAPPQPPPRNSAGWQRKLARCEPGKDELFVT